LPNKLINAQRKSKNVVGNGSLEALRARKIKTAKLKYNQIKESSSNSTTTTTKRDGYRENEGEKERE